MFAIDLDKVCYIIAKAREFEAQVGPLMEESSSNFIDENMVGVMDARSNDAAPQELLDFIGGLNADEQIELVALAWIGRGSFGREDWQEAYEEARRQHNDRTAEYLLGMPLLAEYLSEGLAVFGRACDE